MADDELNRLTERIIGCAFKVSNALGCGFLEKVYENALMHELRKSGLRAVAQQQIKIYYDGVLVGDYFVDIVAYEQLHQEMLAVADLLVDGIVNQFPEMFGTSSLA